MSTSASPLFGGPTPPPVPPFWFNAIPLIVAAISVVVLTILMCRLARAPRVFMGRDYFTRQLLQLAAADVLYAFVSGLCNNLLPILTSQGIDPFSLSKHGKDFLCSLSTVIYMSGQYTSMLLECHIACTFTLTIYRYIEQLDKAHNYIFLVWPLGFALSILDVWLQQVSWQVGVGCVMNAPRDEVFPWVTSVCTMSCLTCYITGSRGVWRSSGAVQKRVWCRAQLYPIVALVTLTPLVLYMGDTPPQINRASLTFCCVGTTLYNSSGILLAVVYGAQRQYYLRGNTRTAADFYVAFRDPDSIYEVSALENYSHLLSRGGSSSNDLSRGGSSSNH